MMCSTSDSSRYLYFASFKAGINNKCVSLMFFTIASSESTPSISFRLKYLSKAFVTMASFESSSSL